MTEETEMRNETINGKSNDGYTITVLILIIAIVFVSCSIFYVNTVSDAKPEESSSVTLEETTKSSVPKNASARKMRMRIQPNCTIREHISKTLKDILSELYLKKVLCSPEDVNNMTKHDVPNFNVKKVAEPRGHLIIYFAVGLLLASLVAAFLDVYKVKGKPLKNKPPLTKRCSLADLTVLRHNRRESMKKDYMVDDHRVPLKLLGARSSTETRRCSVPIYMGEINYGNVSPRQSSRKCSLEYEAHSYDFCHTRARLMRRF